MQEEGDKGGMLPDHEEHMEEDVFYEASECLDETVLQQKAADDCSIGAALKAWQGKLQLTDDSLICFPTALCLEGLDG